MREGNIIDDRFRIARLIGKGGMGSVYRGIDLKRAIPVAIKISHWSDGASVQRFLREAEALSRLEHDGIVRYVAHGLVAAGTPYVAVEWLDGEDLGQRLARGPLSVAETLSLGVQVAEALDAAHGRDILHLDIKPGNLFLVDGDLARVKLLDFGLARVAGMADTLPMRRADEVMGTRGYIPPEQVRGEGRVDERTDLYSLGVVLYSCLVQRPPFLVSQVMGTRVELLFEFVPRVGEARSDVPAALDELIARLMDENPAARVPTARALADELRGIAAAAAAPAPRPPARRMRYWSAIVVGRDARELDSAHLMQAARRHNATLVPSSTDEAVGALFFIHGDHTAVVTSAICCATELRAFLGCVPLAMATGRGELGTPMPVHRVIDRAVMQWRPGAAAADRGMGLVSMAAPSARALAVEAAEFTPAAPPAAGSAPVRTEPRTWAWLPRFVPFLGRKHELDFLALMLEQAIETRSARSLLITGDAGMGKTRLAHELMRRVRPHGASIWTTVGDPMRAELPHDLVRRLALARDLSSRSGTGAPPALGPSDASERAVGSQLREWLEREVAGGPVLIVIDDAQWADRSSMRAMEQALRDAAELPVLVLVLARPWVHEALDRGAWPLRQCSALRLSRLTDEVCEALLCRTLPELSEAQLRRLIRGARGNALHLEELAGRHAAGITTEPGMSLPALIRQHLVASLDRDDGHALQVASSLGRIFRLDDIQAALGRDRASTFAIVARLIELNVLARDWRSGATADYEYGFVSPLVYEAAHALFTEQGQRQQRAGGR